MSNISDKKELLSKLIRELEAEIGTIDVVTIVFDSFINSIKALRINEISDFCEQFKKLNLLIQNTEPKFGILNYYFAYLQKMISKNFKKNKIIEKRWKRVIYKQIKNIIKEIHSQQAELSKHAEEIDIENKTILIHDHSHTVYNVLAHYKYIGKHFKIIIAEQSFDKTQINIERMHHLQIPFQVVPAYMLSHIHKNIDMVFFGSLTLKDTMDFVMVPGALGIISEFNLAKIPVYMFTNTAKFSLWKSKKRSEIFIHKHLRTHLYKPIEYERIKYSHDRVPTDAFKSIITNEGVFTPKGISELFKRKLKEYDELMHSKDCSCL